MAVRTYVRYCEDVRLEGLAPESAERLRRSVAMLTRGQPALDREAALEVLEELQRFQGAVRRAIAELTAALDPKR